MKKEFTHILNNFGLRTHRTLQNLKIEKNLQMNIEIPTLTIRDRVEKRKQRNFLFEFERLVYNLRVVSCFSDNLFKKKPYVITTEMRSLFKLLVARKLIYTNVYNSNVKIVSKTYKNVIKNVKLKKITNKLLSIP